MSRGRKRGASVAALAAAVCVPAAPASMARETTPLRRNVLRHRLARPAPLRRDVLRHRLARPASPARMLIDAQEWSLWPSRPSLPSGQVTVQLWNRGMDAHDLRIRRLNASRTMVGRAQGVRVTLSGQVHQTTWRLRRGVYELYCSMPGHAARGMSVRIAVR